MRCKMGSPDPKLNGLWIKILLVKHRSKTSSCSMKCGPTLGTIVTENQQISSKNEFMKVWRRTNS